MSGDMSKRLGRCYELSGRFVAFEPVPIGRETVLVHGSIEGGGHPRNPHAWVEVFDNDVFIRLSTESETIRVPEESRRVLATAVYDPVMDELLPKELYRVLMCAVEDVRYTPEEVRAKAVESGHWGPWE